MPVNTNDKQHRAILRRIARRAMIERGLLPDFSAEALTELAGIPASQQPLAKGFATSDTFYGLPLTTTTPLTWISLPLPRRCPEIR